MSGKTRNNVSRGTLERVVADLRIQPNGNIPQLSVKLWTDSRMAAVAAPESDTDVKQFSLSSGFEA
ncbi:hypothetical protein AB4Z27_26060 [Cupriavidus sp. KB_39]|uniref:hypothetical protein n=1 Tax=Cupriavidus sp. KB_39 TaxID=3233036 RepID=UPI003F8DE0E4